MTASGDTDQSFWKTFNVCVDIFFLIDILINFNTGYYDSKGELHADRWDIAKNYLKGWFFIDFFSAFPFDLISSRSDGQSVTRLSKLPRVYKVLKTFKILKMFRLMKMGVWIQKFLEKNHIHNAIGRTIKFFIILLFILHLVSCFWIIIGKLEEDKVDTWLVEFDIINESPVI